ncbi:kelch-like protein 3 [Plakobranchus ocellatus]|uniref:Kelch-like protein 3 n=1 Tax=Plakobranchus ocellatus TaxID=259542 RepID=A0AAV4A9L6_9GAST|nr:kelch-like protein 3 [Plakobranchus ocellatus]
MERVSKICWDAYLQPFFSTDLEHEQKTKMDNTGHFINECFATDMMKSLSAYKDNHALSDVTVVAGTTEFPCHRIILAANSEFFRLEGDKKEHKLSEEKVELEKIDGDTFSNILNYIYCGEITFTEDNVWDIWDAARRLKIYFVTEKSKEFFRKTLSLDNCLDYFCQVKHLDKKSYELALDFIQDNFVKLLHLEKFNSLKVDELKCLISGERLNVEHEDDLIEILLKWAENDPCTSPSRIQYLADLIECTRYFLVSKSFLFGRLWCNPLIRSDKKCTTLVEKMIWYNSHSYLHQEWCPPAAVYRVPSKMVNFLFIVNAESDKQLGFHCKCFQNKPYGIFIKFYCSAATLQAFCHDEKLYLCDGDGNITFYSFCMDLVQNKHQHEILKSPVCVVGDYLYICGDGESGKAIVSRVRMHSLFSRKDGPLPAQQITVFDFNEKSILKVTSIGNTLLIFCKSQDKVTITLFDLICRTSTVVPTEFNLPSTNRVTTVRTDSEVFVLEESGDFWRIRRCQRGNGFELVHELMLWDQAGQNQVRLCGAVLVNDELNVVFFSKQPRPDSLTNASLAGVFNKVKLIDATSFHSDSRVDNTFPGVMHFAAPMDILNLFKTNT